MGLNHLVDLNIQISQIKGLYDRILNPNEKTYTDSYFEKSSYYEEYKERIEVFSNIEHNLDNLGNCKQIICHGFNRSKIDRTEIEAD